MNNYQGQNNSKIFLHSKLMLIVFGIIIVFFIFNIIKFSIKAIETNKNKKNAEARLEELVLQKDRLTRDINTLSTQNGVEEIIRDKYGLAKEGEGLIVITDDNNQTNTQNIQTNKSLFSHIKGWFK